MTVDGRDLPPLSLDLELEDFGDESVALVCSERRAVHLAAGPALVVDSCRSGQTRHALIDELAGASGSTREDTGAWLDRVLVELARLGVVAPDRSAGSSSAAPPGPQDPGNC